MGFLNKMLGTRINVNLGGGGGAGRGAGGTGMRCPYCRSTLIGDPEWGENRFECHGPNCGSVFFVENGVLVDPHDPAGKHHTCQRCGSSLKNGASSLPWEDGDNAHASIVCPSCGFQNMFYGMGGD